MRRVDRFLDDCQLEIVTLVDVEAFRELGLQSATQVAQTLLVGHCALVENRPDGDLVQATGVLAVPRINVNHVVPIIRDRGIDSLGFKGVQARLRNKLDVLLDRPGCKTGQMAKIGDVIFGQYNCIAGQLDGLIPAQHDQHVSGFGYGKRIGTVTSLFTGLAKFAFHRYLPVG